MDTEKNEVVLPNNVWAIQLINSSIRIWDAESAYKTKVHFKWNNVLSNEELPYLSQLIKQVKKGDTILGVQGGRNIERIGTVTATSTITSTSVKLTKKVFEKCEIDIYIMWQENWHTMNFQYDIFETIAAIQLMSDIVRYRIWCDFLDPSNIIYRNMIMGSIEPESIKAKLKKDFDLFERRVEETRMGSLMVLASESIDLSPKKDPGGIIRIFYGTNRKKLDETEKKEYYSDERDELKYGYCDVSIPRGHLQGELERPFNFWIIHLDENPEKHIVLETVSELNEGKFFQHLTDGIDRTPQHEALLFIHGYNTTFAEAARRTAQIAWDIPFYGITSFFAWPSAGALLGYPHDETNAEWSYSYLEKFIEKIITKTNIERFHIIAHSLGNKILSFTLKNLAEKEELSERLKVIHQIVLAAPDIDCGVFKKDILPAIKDVGKRKTVYASDKDMALKASETFRMGLPRLGEAGEKLFVADALDTIDASNVKSEIKGHAYIFDTPELLSDLFHLLENELAPMNRRLRPRKWKGKLVYWLFPE